MPVSTDYAIALQRAIEYHCRNVLVPDRVAAECPHHARMLNAHSSALAEDVITDTRFRWEMLKGQNDDSWVNVMVSVGSIRQARAVLAK